MSNKEVIKRIVTLVLPLTETAKSFGYNLETDSQDDVYHDGYRAKDVRKMNPSLPSKYDEADKIFPNEVGMAMEDAERDAYAVAIRKERINAFKNALEKINLGRAEYLDLDGQMISVPACISEAVINESEDTVSITIINPEHLINGIVSGMGYFAADLPTTDAASNKEIEQRFHNVKDYFDVYGDSKPSGDLSSQYSPDVSDDEMTEMLDFRISEITVMDAAEAVIEAVDEGIYKPKEALALAVKLTNLNSDEIKKLIMDKFSNKKEFWKESL